MRYFIHSTLTHDRRFTQWSRPDDRHMSPEIIGTPVFINGGANRATFPDHKFGRHTPNGVMTQVTESQMEYLEGVPAFKRCIEKGFITVTTSKEDSNDIARDMQKKDSSAPITPDSPELNKPDPLPKQGEGLVTKALRVMKDAVA